ncbi:hypothetical protein HZH68_006946 [Vespula germanica]|uniref:Chromatin assembly factor 1 subunit A dimerization domain-containing protein n=1 Tax=Vespula germanica TaxID=30212 RepID=A0A834K8G4_VESGE|nr:hypothetical protein HZH68_006946 [Vespula germanica]
MDMKDDCVIEEVTPSKARKLKQARLTFQLSCSKSLSDNVSSKKRKLESPEECKIPKMVKVTTKGNSIKDSEIDDKVLNESMTSCSSKTDIELIELTDEEEKIQEKSMHHNEEQCDISPIQNSRENSDKDFNVADDDILEVKIDDSETSHNTDIQQNDKLSCADSNSEMDVSSENEDNNMKESENKESISLDIKGLKTPTKTTENTEVMKNKKVTPKLLHKGESAKKRQEKEKLRMLEIKSTEEENNTNVQTFMPFEVKADMRIAPISRRSLNKKEMLSLDDKFNSGRAKNSDLYLAVMKAKKIITHKSEKTWPLEAKDDIVILDEEENGSKSSIIFQPKVVVDKNRPKLLQFHENRRPPYWGTWRKQSNNINPRRPFSKDSGTM